METLAIANPTAPTPSQGLVILGADVLPDRPAAEDDQDTVAELDEDRAHRVLRRVEVTAR